uniref:F-box associated beta-propeller type 3 domain-containing protein n=1 Tax=Tanacetum cinerariifolium TaxID=118510 RepID=A0A6L2J535_TANCI|nr:hypothetical protein [Tanacetum cinerariifolium]
MAVIWNPAIRKSVGIVIPKALYKLQVVGFGVCPRTSDSKLVKISVVKEPSSMWVVSIDGVIYWRAYDDEDLDDGLRSNFIISFDLKSDTFGEVCLPERLVYTHYLFMANMNESLVLLEYNDESSVCGMWMSKNGKNKPFTKIYIVKAKGRSVYHTVLGFRKNGEVVLEVFINGVIYWRAYDDKDLDDGLRSNFIISFDLKSDTFGEVCLSERLVYTHYLFLANMNESLVLLEYNDESLVCGMWMRKDGNNKSFTKIHTVKAKGRSVYHTVLGFKKNGEVVLKVRGFFSEKTEIDVYKPSSGRINSVVIVGKYANTKSYVETLLLLDEPNTIIHS